MPRISLLFSGIRAKIILLAVLGFLGSCLVEWVNVYWIGAMNRDIEVGRKSQEIVRLTLDAMLLEEKYINTGDKTLLETIVVDERDRKAIISEIAALSTDPRIRQAAGIISRSSEEHAGIFSEITQTIETVDRHRNAVSETVLEISAGIGAVIDAVNKSETDLLMQGELLNRNIASLRD